MPSQVNTCMLCFEYLILSHVYIYLQSGQTVAFPLFPPTLRAFSLPPSWGGAGTTYALQTPTGMKTIKNKNNYKKMSNE